MHEDPHWREETLSARNWESLSTPLPLTKDSLPHVVEKSTNVRNVGKPASPHNMPYAPGLTLQRGPE